MQDFSVEGVHKMFGGGPIFRGWNEILLLGKALKFFGNFSKIGIKINKNLQNYWENARKMQIFRTCF